MQETRKVQIVTTKGQNKVGANALVITDDIKTLGQLYPYLQKNNVEYQGMKIMLVEGNFTLEHEEAVLPTGDFWLSLTPAKTKAGASYQEMKTFIKEKRAEAVSSKNQSVVNQIGDYTRMTKSEMTELYEELQDLEVEDVDAVSVSSSNDEVADLKAEILRLKTRINDWIDTIDDLEDEVYEDLDEECEVPTVRQAVVVQEVIPDEVKRLQEWALNNR